MDIKQKAREKLYENNDFYMLMEELPEELENKIDKLFEEIIDLAIAEERERIRKSIIDTEKYEQIMAYLILQITSGKKELVINDVDIVLNDYVVFSKRDEQRSANIFKVIKNTI